MTRQEIETALKLCSSGLDPNCAKCVYAGKGYYRALMRDVLRYIGWLKNENKNGKTKPRPRGKVPKTGTFGADRRGDQILQLPENGNEHPAGGKARN